VSTGASNAALAGRAAAIRANAIRIAGGRGQGYIGQALGTAEIMACLYFGVMDLDGPVATRDRFVLSPGHYALAVYAAEAERGSYQFEELCTYGMDGSRIEESPMEGLPGFEVTGGSLAQGLSQAIGMALAHRHLGYSGRVYCLISDGELEEGQTWEALLSAGHHELGNLIIALDRNRRQVDGPTEEIATLEPVAEKLAAFGLEVEAVDGHEIEALMLAFGGPGGDRGRPRIVVCETELGHGVEAFRAAAYPHYVRAERSVWDDALAGLGVDP
jgi:transketolase